MIQDFQQGDAQRRSEVAAMVKEFAGLDAQRHEEVWGGAALSPTPSPVKEGAGSKKGS